MALKLKEENKNKVVFQYDPVRHSIPNAPAHLPIGFPSYSYAGLKPIHVPPRQKIEMPEANLPRAINYYADYGGCGFWRMIWPEYLMNAYAKACMSGLTQMVMDTRFYGGIKAIRMQRQATSIQKEFIKELTKIKSNFDYRLIYEVDDIVFKDDIPDYNSCKEAFVSQGIEDNILEIMSMMDEITVTCKYMKDYHIAKTGNKKVTVVPNYPPKFWLDGFFNKEKIQKNYELNKKRPRVLYSGSGTHIDMMNKTNFNDDFAHVTQEIIKARKKFKFVWKGCFPLVVKPYIDNGEMEYIEWSNLIDYPKGLYDTNCNVVFAPLQDNVFNKSKSNIKMVEAGGIGLPGAFQDMCTYEEAEFKFKSGSDLISQLEYLTSDYDRYMKLSQKANDFTQKLWLEDHLDVYEAIYFTKWGSKERKEKSPTLIKYNLDQDID